MTATKAQRLVALTVLARIKAHDPSFYKAEDQMVDAWACLIGDTRLSQAELVEAVDKWFKQPHDRHPRAADILTIAKATWKDRFDREDQDGPLHREAYAICDAKAAPDAPELTEGGKLTELKGKSWQSSRYSSPEARQKAVEQFTLRPHPDSRPVRCRLCDAELVAVQTKSDGLLLAHPDGSPDCPEKRDQVQRAVENMSAMLGVAEKITRSPLDRTPEDPT